MKNIKFVACVVAVGVVVFLCALVWAVGLWQAHWVAAAIAFGIGIYYLVIYVLQKFVEEKVKPLYSILNKKPKQKLKSIVSLEGDIRAWAERSKGQMESLKSMENYRKEFLGNVSHELKTPLFSLQGYVDMLLSGVEDEEMRVKYLHRCDNNIERLINIVRDLEDISRLEDQNLVLYKTDFDIVGLFREVSESIANLAEKRSVTVTVVAKNAIFVHADRVRIEQVAVNLLSNAVKYNVEKGNVEVLFEDLMDKVMVQVVDNGVGIPKEHQGRVFERFYRIDKARSREAGGTGLGLAIVKHIVEAHGESINLASEVGKGTTFFFTLKKAFTTNV